LSCFHFEPSFFVVFLCLKTEEETAGANPCRIFLPLYSVAL
jgi:hypothetical protein